MISWHYIIVIIITLFISLLLLLLLLCLEHTATNVKKNKYCFMDHKARIMLLCAVFISFSRPYQRPTDQLLTDGNGLYVTDSRACRKKNQPKNNKVSFCTAVRQMTTSPALPGSINIQSFAHAVVKAPPLWNLTIYAWNASLCFLRQCPCET